MLCGPDAALVQRDRALPGLAILLDPDVFGALLRSSLSGGIVQAVQSTYLRYKPGTSCLAGYRLATGEGSVEVYAKAHRRDAWDKLAKVHQRPSVAGALGPGRFVLEGQAIAVSVFPNDGKLPAIALLADGAAREQLLGRVAPRRQDLRGGTVRGLRYKPERRYVAQVLDANGGPAAVLRLYTPLDYHRASANAKAFASRPPLQIPACLGYSERRNAVALEWVAGRMLDEAIVGPESDLTVLVNVGRALAVLHAQQATTLAHLTREAELAVLAAIAAGVGHICPHLAEPADVLVRRLAARLLREPDLRHSIHGDFYSKQVLLTPAGVVILDFDRAVLGDPAFDLGLFIAHLERDALHGDLTPDLVSAAREALLAGYSAATGQPAPPQVTLQTAAGLLRLAPDPFRYREPEWPERIAAILARADAILSSVDRRAPARPNTFSRQGVRHQAHQTESVSEADSVYRDGTTVKRHDGAGGLPGKGNEASVKPVLLQPTRTAAAKRAEAAPSGSRSASGKRAAEVAVADPFGVADDRQMPFLAQAVDRHEMQRRLERFLPCGTAEGGAAELRAIRVIRYKPGRRCLIEYGLAVAQPGAPPKTITLIGKVRARGLAPSGLPLLASLWGTGFGPDSADGISVPEPAGAIPELHMWLQHKVPGVAATRLLARPDGVPLVQWIAEAVHKLHRAGLPAKRHHTVVDELRILHERLPAVVVSRPRWARRIGRLLDACDRLGAAIPKPAPCGIHRDFYPDQVVVAGSRLYLVDFDLYCQGDPALDAGNFLGHMTEQSLRTLGDPGALADREAALEERFIALAGETTRDAVRAYATLTVVRHIYLSTRFPERQHLTETLLELCEERLLPRR